MPNPIVVMLLGTVAFFLALASDWLETKYVLAVATGHAARAAKCSVGMWLIGVLGLIGCIELGWWLLAPEAAGLYVGTMLAMRSRV